MVVPRVTGIEKSAQPNGKNKTAVQGMFQTGKTQQLVSGVVTGEHKTACQRHYNRNRIQENYVGETESQCTGSNKNRFSPEKRSIMHKQKLAIKHFLGPDREQWVENHDRGPE